MSISFEGAPTLNAICNCSDCGKRTGAPFGWQVYIPDAQVLERIGQSQAYSPAVDPDQIRRFCNDCGTTLWWTSPFRPGETGIAGGAISNPPMDPPTIEARHDHRADWITFPKDVTPYP